MCLENELMQKVKSFTQEAVYEIGRELKESCKDKGFATSFDSETDENGDYGYKFRIYKETDGVIFDVSVVVHFTFIGEPKSENGFYIELLGSCRDGSRRFYDDWKESPLRGCGDFKDFIDILENHHPVQFCEDVIAKFCDSVRHDLTNAA